MTKTIVDETSNGTRNRILDAAEALFSVNGFEQTSMRDITKLANVNLAAVNYHFGTKQDLMQEVFVRCVGPIAKQLNLMLDRGLEQTLTATHMLHHFFQTIIASALENERRKKGGGAIFMRLLSRIYSESQVGLRRALVLRYQRVLVKCIQFFRRATPMLPRAEVFYRIHFSLGSLAFALAGEQELAVLAKRIYQDSSNEQRLLERLVTFIVAGMQADSREL